MKNLNPHPSLVGSSDVGNGAGLSSVDTFLSLKTNKTLNILSQLAVIFTAQVFIATKVTTQVD